MPMAIVLDFHLLEVTSNPKNFKTNKSIVAGIWIFT
jgi:hypothetical protein